MKSVLLGGRGRKAYQREWNGYYVDQNLDNVWLEQLNSLSSFDLISICEGHQNKYFSFKEVPHINVRLKKANQAELLEAQIAEFHAAVQTLFLCRFSSEKHFYAFFNIEVRNDNGSNKKYRMVDLVVSVSPPLRVFKDVEFARKWVEGHQSKNDWFENAITQLIEFDKMWGNDIDRLLIPCSRYSLF